MHSHYRGFVRFIGDIGRRRSRQEARRQAEQRRRRQERTPSQLARNVELPTKATDQAIKIVKRRGKHG